MTPDLSSTTHWHQSDYDEPRISVNSNFNAAVTTQLPVSAQGSQPVSSKKSMASANNTDDAQANAI